jgi:hypothetical protein
MRRAAVVAAGLAIAALAAAACTKTESGAPSGEGEVAVGAITSDVIDAECAEPADVLHASGVGGGPGEDRIVAFDVAVEGETAEATVRVLRGDELEQQFLASGAQTTREGDQVEVAGTFTSFEGPTQTGEVEGTLTFTCEPDTDPGGGLLRFDSTEVAYDLVTCIETDTSYEVRGRATDDPSQVLTLQRTLLAGGWVDRIQVQGDVAVDTDQPTSSEDGPATEAEGGLFEVRGARVTNADGPIFGEEHVGSFDVTCGIDLTAVTDGE